jgi:hypothetical protein
MSAIENECELRYAYGTVMKMYDLRDRIAVEPTGDPELRKEEAISIEMMIHKIERQIAAYLASREKQAEAPLVKTG